LHIWNAMTRHDPSHVASVAEIADRCRSAVLGFFAGVVDGWDKRKLAQWLTGAYSEAVIATSIDASDDDGTPAEKIDDGGERLLSHDRIRELLEQTREECVDLVLALSDPRRAEHFGFYALVAGLVTQVEDAAGHPAWAPVAWRRMTLMDRVLSLVAADYLTRSAEYERELFVCPRCDSVSFDAGARANCACRSCRRPSGMMRAHRDSSTGLLAS
jgi:hypothetical protein